MMHTHPHTHAHTHTHDSSQNYAPAQTFLMMRTLRDMNMSKFVAEDVPLFLALIGDLFPSQQQGEEKASASTSSLMEALSKVGVWV